MNLLLQATQASPSQLATDVIAVIAAITAAVATILGAYALYKSAASAKATDINTQRIGNVSRHVADMDGRQTGLAEKVGHSAGMLEAANRTPQPPIDRPKAT